MGEIVKADLLRRVLLSKLTHNDDETQGYTVDAEGPVLKSLPPVTLRKSMLVTVVKQGYGFSDKEIARGESVGGAGARF